MQLAVPGAEQALIVPIPGAAESILPHPSEGVYLRLLHLPSHYMHRVDCSLLYTSGRVLWGGQDGCYELPLAPSLG